MSKSAESAFPTHTFEFDQNKEIKPLLTGGLTKREYFAAMALQGSLSWRSHDFFDPRKLDEAAVAKGVICLVDALIAELDKK